MQMEEEFQVCDECFESDEKSLALKYYMVINLHSKRVSYNQISEQLSVNKGHISKIVNIFHQDSDVLIDIRQNISRPACLDENDLDFIREIIDSSEDRFQINLTLIKQQLFKEKSKNVSVQTILNYLNAIGRFKLPYTIPCLSSKNQEKRLEFCEYHQNDKFSNVFFTDESQFQVFQNSQRIFQFYDEQFIQKPKPNPNLWILVWGCFSRNKKVPLEIVTGKIDSNNYISLLQKHFPHVGNKLYGNNNWRFQQDNTPAHKSYKTLEWLKDNMTRLIKHPPQSPDLNPVEIIWLK
ncbi:hypothetical protein ABPG72_020006 [Tetrahymena utriculariae]